MSDQTFAKSDASSEISEPSVSRVEAGLLDDPIAAAHEVKVQGELSAQFQELKRQAQGIFEAVKGRIGARNEEYLQQVFTKAGEDYASGQFLMQRLGADRQLDLPLVATLTQLRHDLLAVIEHPSAADYMLADSAILAYRNLLRVQGWLGSLCLQIERNLFGQSPLSDVNSRDIESMMQRIEERLLPMSERCERMLCRALDGLETRRSAKGGASVSIGIAGQVNVGRG